MAVSPLYFLDSAERKEAKQIAGIKGGFICKIIENFICAYT